MKNLKNTTASQDKKENAQQRNVDVFPTSLSQEEREKRIRRAAQVTVKKYGQIIERLSEE